MPRPRTVHPLHRQARGDYVTADRQHRILLDPTSRPAAPVWLVFDADPNASDGWRDTHSNVRGAEGFASLDRACDALRMARRA